MQICIERVWLTHTNTKSKAWSEPFKYNCSIDHLFFDSFLKCKTHDHLLIGLRECIVLCVFFRSPLLNIWHCRSDLVRWIVCIRRSVNSNFIKIYVRLCVWLFSDRLSRFLYEPPFTPKTSQRTVCFDCEEQKIADRIEQQCVRMIKYEHELKWHTIEMAIV